jgi:hypothetical protein
MSNRSNWLRLRDALEELELTDEKKASLQANVVVSRTENDDEEESWYSVTSAGKWTTMRWSVTLHTDEGQDKEIIINDTFFTKQRATFIRLDVDEHDTEEEPEIFATMTARRRSRSNTDDVLERLVEVLASNKTGNAGAASSAPANQVCSLREPNLQALQNVEQWNSLVPFATISTRFEGKLAQLSVSTPKNNAAWVELRLLSREIPLLVQQLQQYLQGKVQVAMQDGVSQKRAAATTMKQWAEEEGEDGDALLLITLAKVADVRLTRILQWTADADDVSRSVWGAYEDKSFHAKKKETQLAFLNKLIDDQFESGARPVADKVAANVREQQRAAVDQLKVMAATAGGGKQQHRASSSSSTTSSSFGGGGPATPGNGANNKNRSSRRQKKSGGGNHDAEKNAKGAPQ